MSTTYSPTTSRPGFSEFFQELGRPITFYPVLARMLGGDIKASLFLSQLLYWTPRAKTDWIFKTSAELEIETALTAKEQRRIREVLVERGLLEVKYRRLEHRLYFRVDRAALNRAWSAYQATGVTPEAVDVAPEHGGHVTKGQMGKGAKGNSAMDERAIRYPEMTSEKTTEMTERDTTVHGRRKSPATVDAVVDVSVDQVRQKKNLQATFNRWWGALPKGLRLGQDKTAAWKIWKASAPNRVVVDALLQQVAKAVEENGSESFYAGNGDLAIMLDDGSIASTLAEWLAAQLGVAAAA